MRNSGEKTRECRERLLIVILIMLALFGIDASSGPEFSPWVAYLVPVAMASRYCGLSTGAAYAVLAGGLLCIASRHSGHPYSSDTHFFVAVASQSLALLAVAWLTAQLSSLERTLSRLARQRSTSM